MFRLKTAVASSSPKPVILEAYQRLAKETSGLFSPHDLLEENPGISDLTPYQEPLKLIPKSVVFLVTRPQVLPKPRTKAEVESGSDSGSGGKGVGLSEAGKAVIPGASWSSVNLETQWDLLASLLIEPFVLAFMTNIAYDLALDSMHKLFASGYVQGSSFEYFSPATHNIISNISRDQELSGEEKTALEAKQKEAPASDRTIVDEVVSVFSTYVWAATCITNTWSDIDSNKDKVLARITNLLMFLLESCDVHGVALRKAIIILFNTSLPRSGISPPVARATLTRAVTEYFSKFSPSDIGADLRDLSTKKSKDSKRRGLGTSEEIAFVDCDMIVSEMCVQIDRPANNPQEIKRKVQALEVIQQILENYSSKIKKSPKFLEEVVKRKICASSCCVSINIPFVFSVTISILKALVDNFRAELKAQIGVLFSMIFSVLKTNSKWIKTNEKLALIYFKSIFSDPNIFCDLYVNYDCDVHHQDDVLGTIIELIAKFAYKREEGPEISNMKFALVYSVQQFTGLNFPEPEESELLHLSLEAFVSMLVSLNTWSESFRGKNSVRQSDMGSDDLQYQRQLKEYLKQASQIFDINPEQAFAHLVSCHVLKDATPRTIGYFLVQNTTYFEPESLMLYLKRETDILKCAAKGLRWNTLEIDEALTSFLRFLRFKKWARGHETRWVFLRFVGYYLLFGKTDHIKDAETALGILKGITYLSEVHGRAHANFKFWKQRVLKYISKNLKDKKRRDKKDKDVEELESDSDSDSDSSLDESRDETDDALGKGRGDEEGAGAETIIVTRSFWEFLQHLHTRVLSNYPLLRMLNKHDYETRRLMKKATRQKYWRAKMERTFQLPTTNTALVDGSITTTTTISPAAVAVNRIGRRNKFAHEKEYIRAANPLNAKWILQSNWATVLALLTNFWSEANEEDTKLLSLCLRGIKETICLSSTFQMKTEQTALVSTLTKMCGISTIFNTGHVTSGASGYSTGGIEPSEPHREWGKNETPKETAGKRVEAIKAMFATAEKNGDLLRECWVQILQVCSQLEILHNLPLEQILLRKQAEKIKRHINVRMIAQLFTQSLCDDHLRPPYSQLFSKLSQSGFYDFIVAMCQVAQEELAQQPPSTFMTIKLAEVMAINSSSTDRDWKKLWKLTSKSLLKFLFSNNKDAALIVCESLRMVISHLLDTSVDSHDVLTPIKALSKPATLSSLSVEVREYILQILWAFFQNPDKLSSEESWAFLLKSILYQLRVGQEKQILQLALDLTDVMTTITRAPAKSKSPATPRRLPNLGRKAEEPPQKQDLVLSFKLPNFDVFLRILASLGALKEVRPRTELASKTMATATTTPAMEPDTPKTEAEASRVSTNTENATTRAPTTDIDDEAYKCEIRAKALALLELCSQNLLACFKEEEYGGNASENPKTDYAGESVSKDQEVLNQKLVLAINTYIYIAYAAPRGAARAARGNLLAIFSERTSSWGLPMWLYIFKNTFKIIIQAITETEEDTLGFIRTPQEMARIVEVSNAFVCFFADDYAIFFPFLDDMLAFLNDILDLGVNTNLPAYYTIHHDLAQESLSMLTTKLGAFLKEQDWDKMLKVVEKGSKAFKTARM